jgi:PAS domain S-box-containing protein
MMTEPPIILIVDDDLDVLRTWEMILTRKNYRVLTAPDGMTALELARQNALHLALLDIRLPDISGADLLPQLKALHPDLQALILTGNATLESAIQALANGAYRYLLKPIHPDELLAALEQALEKQRLVIENRQLLLDVQRELEDRKRAEAALRESERRLSTLLSNLPGMAYRCANDEHWTMEFVSEGCVALTGYTPADLIHNARISYAQVIHPEDRAPVWEQVQDALQAKRPFQLTYRICCADGTEKWVWEQGRGVFAEDGTLVALEGFITDITDRVRAEQALQAERDFAQQILNTLGQGVTVVNREGVFEYVNPAYARLVGRSPEELIGKHTCDVTIPEDHTLLTQQRARRHRGESSTYETRLVHADGHLVPVTISGVPRWRSGQIIGSIAVITDLTEHYQREREIQAVAAISAALRAATTRDEMLPIILDHTMQLMNASAAMIITRRSVTEEAVIECARGVWAGKVGRRTPSGKGLSALILTTKQPYVTNDLASDPNTFWKDWGEEVRAFAGVPLITAKDQVIGILGIGRTLPIVPEEVRVLVAIADIAANALHRATLHEQTERRLHHLLALQAVDQAINASLDLRVTLDILIDQVMSQLHADAADVLLYNPAIPALVYTVGRGFRQPIEQLTLRLGEGYAGRVARERRTLIFSPYVAADNAAHFASEGFVTYSGVPLIAKGQLTGVLEVFRRASFSPDAEWINLLETLALQAAIAINNARLYEQVQHTNLQLTLSYETTIASLARALELRAQESAGHIRRVTDLTEQFARALRIPDTQLLHLRYGAMLHDIGKLALPAPTSTDPLNEDDTTRRHPKLAYQLLQPIPYLQPALDIPCCHHEKWDGSGYPNGLKGEAIPLAARLFAIVDTWDILRSMPPYCTTWSEHQAREYLRAQAGKAFDPNLVETFLRLV